MLTADFANNLRMIYFIAGLALGVVLRWFAKRK